MHNLLTRHRFAPTAPGTVLSASPFPATRNRRFRDDRLCAARHRELENAPRDRARTEGEKAEYELRLSGYRSERRMSDVELEVVDRLDPQGLLQDLMQPGEIVDRLEPRLDRGRYLPEAMA